MSDPITVEEKVYLMSWAVAYNNCEQSRRLFRKKYNKDAPPISTVKYWKAKFIETGSLVTDRQRAGRPRSASNDENKENVCAAVRENPSTSVRVIAAELNMSIGSVHNILKEENFHPFKPVSCQLLFDGDTDRRMQFCEVVRDLLNHDPAFMRKLKFSDECVFSLQSRVNQHNVHHWETENPHIRIGRSNKTPTLTVWACVGYGGIVDFDISPATMNSERYCDIINNKVIPHFTAGHHEQWIYQHDGAPSHFSVNARQLLDGSLPGRWYGRRGAVEWPPRSPDLTVCDFWLWAYLRSKVYNPPGRVFPNLTSLQETLQVELSRIPLSMFRRAINDFPRRIHRCLEAEGDLFE